MKIVGLGGSLRATSCTRAALTHALRLVAEQGAQTELLDVRELNLPMFLPDASPGAYPLEHQPSITRLLSACRSAHAMVWASPTYHGTVSGAVKNAIDFVELMSNDDPPYLTGRAVGLITINDSTAWAALRDSVHELRAWIAPTSLMLTRADFTPEMTLHEERPQRRMARLVAELMEFANGR
jgi:FMN reductase